MIAGANVDGGWPMTGTGGLGLAVAVAINLCGGLCLGAWLVFGSLNIPTKGEVLLWVLAAILVRLSVAEWVRSQRLSPFSTMASP